MNIALDTNFPMPGDAAFPLNQAFETPKDRGQAEMLRQYLSQVRQETAARLLDRLFADGETPSKVIICFFCEEALANFCLCSGGSALRSASSWAGPCRKKGLIAILECEITAKCIWQVE